MTVRYLSSLSGKASPLETLLTHSNNTLQQECTLMTCMSAVRIVACQEGTSTHAPHLEEGRVGCGPGVQQQLYEVQVAVACSQRTDGGHLGRARGAWALGSVCRNIRIKWRIQHRYSNGRDHVEGALGAGCTPCAVTNERAGVAACSPASAQHAWCIWLAPHFEAELCFQSSLVAKSGFIQAAPSPSHPWSSLTRGDTPTSVVALGLAPAAHGKR